ncbi:hypothetical protein D3C75_1132200 [compost metagenome]
MAIRDRNVPITVRKTVLPKASHTVLVVKTFFQANNEISCGKKCKPGRSASLAVLKEMESTCKNG